MFPGFYRPKSNFYRLPNEWFDIWRQVRREAGWRRIVAILKVIEYVIKWTWGFCNYNRPVRIAWRAFQYGRREGNSQLDRGTGMSSRSLQKALDEAVKRGLLEKSQQEGEDGPSYLPHLRPPQEDPPEAAEAQPEQVARRGFDNPRANFFLVPAIWTDLTCNVTSETLILTVEYLFRHTWGFQGGSHEPCWLSEEEIAEGRLYRSKERRGEKYDQGIGYSVKQVQRALGQAVEKGWVVWRKRNRRREYALHLTGMIVSEQGEFLGFEPQEAEKPPVEPAPPAAKPAAQTEDAPATMAAEIASLRQAVARLSQQVAGLLKLVAEAGLDVSTADRDKSKAQKDESKAEKDESKAQEGQKYSASYTDTPSDSDQTPPPDTAGGGRGAAAVKLPQDLEAALQRIGFRGRKARHELAQAYGEEPERIRGWIERIAASPADYQRPAGFLLQTVVREGEPLPVQAPEEGEPRTADANCPDCHGSGVIQLHVPETDPDYGKRYPCTRCKPTLIRDHGGSR